MAYPMLQPPLLTLSSPAVAPSYAWGKQWIGPIRVQPLHIWTPLPAPGYPPVPDFQPWPGVPVQPFAFGGGPEGFWLRPRAQPWPQRRYVYGYSPGLPPPPPPRRPGYYHRP
eukprot:EG_transcript_54593